MRTKNSIINSLSSIVCYIISIVIGFVTQSVIIKVLGPEYLGLNGLFTNVITMLNIFELGIGSAIIYKLYDPVAKNDVEDIKSLIDFYKKSYSIIGILVLITGLIIIPFLHIIVKDVNLNINIYYVYLLFLFQTVSSYFISYKRSLIYANQKNYYINYVHIGTLLFFNSFRIILLYFTKNYYIYLVVIVFGQIIENIIISYIANVKYPYLKDKNIKKLSKSSEQDIITKVKALFFHKIASVIVNGTDNIIISYFLGLTTVGIYSNYNIIISYVQGTFNQIISSTTSSVGNLLVTEKDSQKLFVVFSRIRFLNFWIACFTSISLLLIVNPFITLWVGKKYLLSEFVIIILIINNYQKIMRSSYMSFKESAGIFVEDKFVPLVESLLNIVFSILFLKIFGLAGVFLGTITSSLALWCYSYPKFVYKKIFQRSYINYILETLGYFLLGLFISLICFLLSKYLYFTNVYFELIFSIFISTFICNILLIIIFHKSENYNYFKKLIFNILNSKLRRRVKLCKEKKI